MNLYLLHFTHRNKPEFTWFEAVNAGEGVNLIEAIGVDVIETAKVTNEEQRKHIKHTFYELKSKIRFLQKSRDYRHHEANHPCPSSGSFGSGGFNIGQHLASLSGSSSPDPKRVA